MSQKDKDYDKQEKGKEKETKGSAVRGITRKGRRIVIKPRR